MRYQALIAILLAIAAPGIDPARSAVAAHPHSTWPGAVSSMLPQTQAAPHPAVARVIVPEGNATSYGSGTLVDVRDEFGLVVTNWHVVRDATGTIEVVFPGGFRSYGRALKIDRDWDLAALVIWSPPLEPVPLAPAAPRPGDVLTIAGHGQGRYRAATGRCTQYLAPGVQFPYEMVEVNVEARQGDSGGPIFNEGGQLAGVLFGAGHGTTTGSYAGRVRGFLASVAPDLGRQPETMIATTPAKPASTVPAPAPVRRVEQAQLAENPPRRLPPVAEPPASPEPLQDEQVLAAVPAGDLSDESLVTWRDIAGPTPFDQIKTIFALVGVIATVVCVFRLAGR